MTAAEWAEFAGRVEATFRGGLEDDREHELRRHFERVPFDVAVRAIATLVADEQIFVPTPGEFRRALRRTVGDGWPLRVALSGLTSDELLAQIYGGGRDHLQLTEGSTAA